MIVSIVELDNIGISKLNIHLALQNKKDKFTMVVHNYSVPLNKTKSITTGTFPA
jgi:hypothetical protein